MTKLLNLKKYLLIIGGVICITLFSIVGFNGEPIVYVFKYVIKYIFRPKLYLYKKYKNLYEQALAKFNSHEDIGIEFNKLYERKHKW